MKINTPLEYAHALNQIETLVDFDPMPGSPEHFALEELLVSVQEYELGEGKPVLPPNEQMIQWEESLGEY